MKIAIVGGGLIGITIAWRLLKAGHKVVIFEKGILGKQASYAAAGMLAPQIEAEAGEEALTKLLLEAKSRWPSFIEELKENGITNIGYRDEGTFLIAANNDELAQLKRQYAYHQRFNIQTEWLSSYQLRKKLPRVSRQVAAGIFSKTDHQVDNRLLLQQLIEKVVTLGAEIKEETLVDFSTESKIKQFSSNFDKVIVTTGAWPLLPELATKIRPIKGQMLAVQTNPQQPLTEYVLWGSRIYLVPRQDGRLLIGATIEEQGFDTTITAGGLRQLLNDAVTLLPDIDEYPVIETWSGLRPGSPDDAPIWQYSLEYPNIILAMGHYRNGVLLAPMAGEEILKLLSQ